jgi:hypothetical protein
MEIPPRGREVRVALWIATLPDSDDLDPERSLLCLVCDEELEVHQPDPDCPERMLATCGQCRSWYLVECDGDSGETLLVGLPDPDQIREADAVAQPA